MSLSARHFQACTAIADAARFNALQHRADDLEQQANTATGDVRHDLLREALDVRVAAIRLLTGEAA